MAAALTLSSPARRRGALESIPKPPGQAGGAYTANGLTISAAILKQGAPLLADPRLERRERR